MDIQKVGLQGGTIQNKKGIISCEVHVLTDCEIHFKLMVAFEKDRKKQKYVKFTSITVNDKEYLGSPVCVTHDFFHSIAFKVQKGSLLMIKGKFQDLNMMDFIRNLKKNT